MYVAIARRSSDLVTWLTCHSVPVCDASSHSCGFTPSSSLTAQACVRGVRAEDALDGDAGPEDSSLAAVGAADPTERQVLPD